VLVHFTGGDDLTLHEVGAAVDDLRSNLAPEVELILGASTDPAMTGRAQAILVVTGVGGQPAPTQETIPVAQRVSDTVTIQTGSPIAQDDLDLPTFLRRRVAVQ
jgi:cell division protein FtsZ